MIKTFCFSVFYNRISFGCCGRFTLAELLSFSLSVLLVLIWVLTGHWLLMDGASLHITLTLLYYNCGIVSMHENLTDICGVECCLCNMRICGLKSSSELYSNMQNSLAVKCNQRMKEKEPNIASTKKSI